MGVGVLASERRQRIIRQLDAHGRVEVSDLVGLFHTSGETIRKDLISLEREGMLRRVHGGALRSEATTHEASLSARTEQDAEKAAIARRALEEVPSDGAVVFDAGTTTQKLADAITAGPNLRVFTNALPIAAALADKPGVACHTLGGRVRGLTLAEVGATALERISVLHFDVAFVGTNALNVNGLSTPDPEEAAVKRTMIANSDYVVLLCDATKFGSTSLVTYASLAEIDLLITDSTPRGDLAAALSKNGVEVQKA